MNYSYKIFILEGIKGKFIEESFVDGETQLWNLSVFSGKQVAPYNSAFIRTSEWLKNNHPEEII